MKHFVKDMRIALESAEEMGIELPGLECAKRLYDTARRRGRRASSGRRRCGCSTRLPKSGRRAGLRGSPRERLPPRRSRASVAGAAGSLAAAQPGSPSAGATRAEQWRLLGGVRRRARCVRAAVRRRARRTACAGSPSARLGLLGGLLTGIEVRRPGRARLPVPAERAPDRGGEGRGLGRTRSA